MKKCLLLIVLCPTSLLCQSNTTTYLMSTQACVHLSNCILYGPGESWSLWEADSSSPLPTSDFAIFSIYNWVGGFSVVNTYRCDTQSYVTQSLPSPAPLPTLQITASCSGVDSNAGLPFSLNYVIYAYSYVTRGGGGKGGGGAGTLATGLPAAQ
jgi:hypothetical protein